MAVTDSKIDINTSVVFSKINELNDYQIVVNYFKETLVSTQYLKNYIEFLDHYCHLNWRDKNGLTLLSASIYNKYNLLTGILLQRNDIDLNLDLNLEFAPLNVAVEQHNHKLVSQLLEKGANPNIGNNTKFIPLYIAVRKEYFRIFQLLLVNGAYECINYHIPQKNTFTVLHAMIDHNYFNMFKLILQFKTTNLNIKTNDVSVPLLYVINQGDSLYLEEMVKLLLSHGANVNEVSNTRKNNALITLLVQLDSVIYNTPSFYNIAKMLVKYNINVNYQNRNNITALHAACMYNLVEIVKLLCEQPNINTELKNEDNDTAYDLAIYFEHTEIINYFDNFVYKSKHILNTFITNHVNNQKTRLLDIFIKNHIRKQISNKLIIFFNSHLEKQQNITSTNSTSTNSTSTNSPTKLDKLIVDDYPTKSLLELLVKTNDIDTLEKTKFNLNSRDIFGKTLLDYAFIHQNKNMIKFLINNDVTF